MLPAWEVKLPVRGEAAARHLGVRVRWCACWHGTGSPEAGSMAAAVQGSRVVVTRGRKGAGGGGGRAAHPHLCVPFQPGAASHSHSAGRESLSPWALSQRLLFLSSLLCSSLWGAGSRGQTQGMTGAAARGRWNWRGCRGRGCFPSCSARRHLARAQHQFLFGLGLLAPRHPLPGSLGACSAESRGGWAEPAALLCRVVTQAPRSCRAAESRSKLGWPRQGRQAGELSQLPAFTDRELCSSLTQSRAVT